MPRSILVKPLQCNFPNNTGYIDSNLFVLIRELIHCVFLCYEQKQQISSYKRGFTERLRLPAAPTHVWRHIVCFNRIDLL